MIKKILVACALLAMVAALFCQTTDSRKGYFDLPWGSTVEDAKKAGYKLKKKDSGGDKVWLEPVDAYSAVSKDKLVNSLNLYYYNGKLFLAIEKVQMVNDLSKLESRYGRFEERGIKPVKKRYNDSVLNDNGKVLYYSISIVPKDDGTVDTMQNDWNVLKEIDRTMQKFTDRSNGVAGAHSLKPCDSRKGYFDLPWGSTVEDAKKAGYKLAKIDSHSELWLHPVDAYEAFSRDGNVMSLSLYYYKGKLFHAMEFVKIEYARSALEARYGDFKKNGINEKPNINRYTDWVLTSKGKLVFQSIYIGQNDDGVVSASMYDWDVYKTLDKLTHDRIDKDIAVPAVKNVDTTRPSLPLEDFAKKLVNSGDGKISTYAVLNFSSDLNNADYEEYVTNILTSSLFATGAVKIVERANLKRILKEQNFQASGLVDERTAKAIGKISGADYVCCGSINDMGQKIAISARVIDVETGEICAMSRDTIMKDEYLLGFSSKK